MNQPVEGYPGIENIDCQYTHYHIDYRGKSYIVSYQWREKQVVILEFPLIEVYRAPMPEVVNMIAAIRLFYDNIK